jgi:hypothetical protein
LSSEKAAARRGVIFITLMSDEGFAAGKLKFAGGNEVLVWVLLSIFTLVYLLMLILYKRKLTKKTG